MTHSPQEEAPIRRFDRDMSTSIAAVAAPSPSRFEVLGQRIDAVKLDTAREALAAAVSSRRKTYFTFCTVSSLLAARDDPRVRSAFDEAGLVTPDGMPLVWIGRRNGRDVERVYGPDFMLEVFTREKTLKHFFYGGAPGVASELVARLSDRYPHLRIAGVLSPGYLSGCEVMTEHVDIINASGADVVWVGLGHPKQELWMQTHRETLEAPVLAGVGAAFDFLSGRKKEAPVWVQRAGLQWAQRLASDPLRLWRRYLVGNFRFLLLVIRENLGISRS